MMLKPLILLLLMACILPLSVQAEELMTREHDPLKTDFYSKCVMSVNPLAKPESIETSCLCMSAHLKKIENAENEEIQKQQLYSVFEAAPVKKQMSQKELFLQVYAPCLYLTVYDMVYDQCYYNKEYHRYMASRAHLKGMCNCMASESEAYFKDLAQARLAVLIHEGLYIEDPLQSLLDDIEYESMFSDNRRRCFMAYTKNLK